MSAKLPIHIFNQSIFDGKLPNKDIINDLGIYWAGVADKKPFYNIEDKKVSDEDIIKSILSLSNNLFTVESKHTLFTIGDTYTPFELLVKLRFENDKESAETFLIERGYNDVAKYIENLIFNDKRKFDPFKATEYLKADGYLRVSEQGRDETVVYKIDNGIMREFNVKSDTVSLFKTKLKGHPKE